MARGLAHVQAALAQLCLYAVDLRERCLAVAERPRRWHVELVAGHREHVDIRQPDGTHPHSLTGQSRPVLTGFELTAQPSKRRGHSLDRNGGGSEGTALLGDPVPLVPDSSGPLARSEEDRRNADDHQQGAVHTTSVRAVRGLIKSSEASPASTNTLITSYGR